MQKPSLLVFDLVNTDFLFFYQHFGHPEIDYEELSGTLNFYLGKMLFK